MSRPLRKLARSSRPASRWRAAAAGRGRTAAPLPRSNYAVRPACAAPAPGRAAASPMQLVPVTADGARHAARSGWCVRRRPGSPPVPRRRRRPARSGLRPQDLHGAYSLPDDAPGEPTIGSVDAYNDPTAEADLQTYDRIRPASMHDANGCFTQVNQKAEPRCPSRKPPKNSKTASKAPSKRNAKKPKKRSAGASRSRSTSSRPTRSARTAGSCSSRRSQHLDCTTSTQPCAAPRRSARARSRTPGAARRKASPRADDAAFNDPGTVITASAGDDGYLNWDRKEPATPSPRSPPPPRTSWRSAARGSDAGRERRLDGRDGLERHRRGRRRLQRRVHRAPLAAAKPPAGPSVGCADRRAVADVSADADPYTGVVIRDTDDPGKECRTRHTKKRRQCTRSCRLVHLRRHQPGLADRSPRCSPSRAARTGVAYPAQTLYETRARRAGDAARRDRRLQRRMRTRLQRTNGHLAVLGRRKRPPASCCIEAAPAWRRPATTAQRRRHAERRPRRSPPASRQKHPPNRGGRRRARRDARPPAGAGHARARRSAARPAHARRRSALSLTSAVIALDRRPTRREGRASPSRSTCRDARARHARTPRALRTAASRWVTVGHPATIARAAGRNVKRLDRRRRACARGALPPDATPARRQARARSSSTSASAAQPPCTP